MKKTRKKLLEARFFLDLMIKNIDDVEHFKYYLSAFLSAFASVDFLMMEEHKARAGFDKWYRDMRLKIANNHDIKLLMDKRTVTIHYELVEPDPHVDVTIELEVLRLNVVFPVIQVSVDDALETIVDALTAGNHEAHDPRPQGRQPTTANGTGQKWRWTFDDKAHSDVIGTCQAGLLELEKIVAECEVKFPVPSRRRHSNR